VPGASIGKRILSTGWRIFVSPVPRTLRLRLAMWKTQRDEHRAIEAARRNGATAVELHNLKSEWFHTGFTLHQELETIYTQRLVAKAHRLRVPIPQKPARADATANEHWEFGMESVNWYLKPDGYRKLGAEIRAERKARHEMWLPWLTLIASLIAAITGLVVILTK
jgi:hypothetical protein